MRTGTHRAERDDLCDARHDPGLETVRDQSVDQPVRPAPPAAVVSKDVGGEHRKGVKIRTCRGPCGIGRARHTSTLR